MPKKKSKKKVRKTAASRTRKLLAAQSKALQGTHGSKARRPLTQAADRALASGTITKAQRDAIRARATGVHTMTNQSKSALGIPPGTVQMKTKRFPGSALADIDQQIAGSKDAKSAAKKRPPRRKKKKK